MRTVTVTHRLTPYFISALLSQTNSVCIKEMVTGGLDHLFQTTGGSVWLPDISESQRGNSDTASWIKYHSDKDTKIYRSMHTHSDVTTFVFLIARMTFFAHAVTFMHTNLQHTIILLRSRITNTSRHLHYILLLYPFQTRHTPASTRLVHTHYIWISSSSQLLT